MQVIRSLRIPCAALIVSVGSMVFVVGCGNSKEAQDVLTGNVTVNGEKVASGSISFHGAKTVSGPITDGKYKVDNVPVGDLKVSMKSLGGAAPPQKGSIESGEAAPKDKIKGLPGMGGGGAAIPKKYESAETSGLTYTMKAGKHTKDFDLEK